MVELNDVSKHYGKKVGVKNLSFKTEPGQIIGLLGANGAGKTTTIKLITGYFTPDSGQILVDGIDMAEEPEKAKKRIGYLPEDAPLYRDMTVWEHLVFFAELKGVKNHGQLREIAEQTGLAEALPRTILNLSKGYRQRVGLAQALIGSPHLLMLDEPTNGFDPKQRSEVFSLLRGLAADKTIILSSHILSEIEAVCDRILILKNGVLVADGAPQSLSSAAAGTQLFTLQVLGKAAAVQKILNEVKGVQAVRATACVDTGCSAFEVEAQGDIRPALFYALAGAKLPIMELKKHTASLETLFLDLTKQQ